MFPISYVEPSAAQLNCFASSDTLGILAVGYRKVGGGSRRRGGGGQERRREGREKKEKSNNATLKGGEGMGATL